MSNEANRWLLKVLQPEATLGSLPGIDALAESTRAALLGMDPDLYRTTLAELRSEVNAAAEALLADPDVGRRIDHLPLKKGARVVAFGDSHTADPQSWARILAAMLATRRASDEIDMTIRAVPGETTTHGLVRVGEVIARQPDWLLVFLGVNDARTQGPRPTKTLVEPSETARNLAELAHRVSSETNARCLWITPAGVEEARVASHWGLSRFGVRFRNEDVARVAGAVRALGGPTVDLVSLGAPPASELLMDDGLHFTIEGQKRIALEVLRGWSDQYAVRR
jgi:lysophospholipase L1-like esterase